MSTDRQKFYMEQWQNQKDYHSKKAGVFKQRYQLTQAFIVLGSLSVPVMLGMSGIPTWVPTVISLLVAFAAGLENVFKNGENWISFRKTTEMLKREQRMFMARGDVYGASNQNAFELFVQRVEAILGEQNQIWSNAHRPAENSQAQNSAPIPPGAG
jgi:Protein of unknown function (DUF4231)